VTVSHDDGVIVLGSGEGRPHRSPVGDVLLWKAGEEATGGAYSLHERSVTPGTTSLPHIHHELVEAFFVLEGAFEFTVGGRTIAGLPGTFVLVPRGVAHGWTAGGGGPARALVLFTPSARREFFEKLDDLAQSAGPGGVDPATLLELSREYGWA